ncbi:3-oxoacyl-[acyl-carrier-protein] synthase-3 [Friedmanniella endophytica]|uniref:3-oxoacyl-[acyl-carrier-protein] synthase-3 n=1 Tax=Microlunatus kandeliicorticis TaxID=1759536 RepID=A0A7W3IT79_9ACTN|nr:beta-ketoacyl-ACP synthase III [Microlunatus kandeliicorticis]MBA8794828.1 3-oxoacyl-[acyl-carrier-protein] synthase-3 [Microlunatus kandeliicorticis]
MTGSRLVAVGHFQPARVVPNSELESMVDTNDEWIQRRVGIRERRWAGPDETVDVMATKAAQDVLAKAGVEAAEVDMVIVATCSALDRSPNMASRVALALGMTNHPATLDINTACSGFPHAVAIAQHAIGAGAARTALVIGAEKLSDVTDYTDRTTCVLTADGAGAFLLTADPDEHISPVLWGCVPEMGDAVRIERAEGDKFAQNGRAVFRWTTYELPQIARDVLDRAKVAPENLAAIVLHQANLRIIEPLARQIGAVNARVATDVVESGNTSAASIPLALSKMLEKEPLPSGAPILLFAFGGGLAYAGQVVLAP